MASLSMEVTPAAAGRPASLETIYNPSEQGALFWTSTGRSALRPVLLYLREMGALRDKNAEVLVPRWACLSLYHTFRKVCFPTLQDTPALAGVLAYHQYGFPQRMDRIAERCHARGLFLLEDCVNSVFDGPAHGVSDYGSASIFSLSKIFHTTLGGALLVRDEGMKEYCNRYFRQDERWIGRLSYCARWLVEHSGARPSAQRFQELVYGISDYGRLPMAATLRSVRRQLRHGILARRQETYERLRNEFADTPFFHGLEPGVIPYLVPLFGPVAFLARLSRKLVEKGWETGIYHFDEARDVFEPRFVPCVPLPIHQEIAFRRLDSLIEVIRREWKNYDSSFQKQPDHRQL